MLKRKKNGALSVWWFPYGGRDSLINPSLSFVRIDVQTALVSQHFQTNQLPSQSLLHYFKDLNIWLFSRRT